MISVWWFSPCFLSFGNTILQSVIPCFLRFFSTFYLLSVHVYNLLNRLLSLLKIMFFTMVPPPVIDICLHLQSLRFPSVLFSICYFSRHFHLLSTHFYAGRPDCSTSCSALRHVVATSLRFRTAALQTPTLQNISKINP